MKINKQKLLKNELERQKLLEIIKQHFGRWDYILEIKESGVVVMTEFAGYDGQLNETILIPWSHECFDNPEEDAKKEYQLYLELKEKYETKPLGVYFQDKIKIDLVVDSVFCKISGDYECPMINRENELRCNIHNAKLLKNNDGEILRCNDCKTNQNINI